MDDLFRSVERVVEIFQKSHAGDGDLKKKLTSAQGQLISWRSEAEKTGPEFNRAEVEQYIKEFLDFSKDLELSLIKRIKLNQDELAKKDMKKSKEECQSEIASGERSLCGLYVAQAEIFRWLCQYLLSTDQQVAYYYRTQLRLLLLQKRLEDSKIQLSAQEQERAEIVSEQSACDGRFILSQISDTQAMEIYRIEFINDLQLLGNKVIERLEELRSYERIESFNSLRSFLDLYCEAQKIAVVAHKGISNAINRTYYRNVGVKKFNKWFREIEALQPEITRHISGRNLFDLVAALEKQGETLDEVIKRLDTIKKHFGIGGSSLAEMEKVDIDKLKGALENQELLDDFQYRLRQNQRYVKQFEEDLQRLKQLLAASKDDLHKHHFSQFYNCFERLFLACKVISSGLIKHTHQGKLGKVGALMTIVSGPLKQVPVVGSALSIILQAGGTAATEIDYQRTVNTLVAFDALFSEESLKYLANYLAYELVNTHYHQLPYILSAPVTVVAKGKAALLRETNPTVFSRVSEYFCSRAFAVLMSSGSLCQELQTANKAANSQGADIDFISRIGSLILDDLSHYENAGIIGGVNNFLLNACKVTWKDVGNMESLHRIFGIAHVFTETGDVFKHKEYGADNLISFGFIQSSQRRATLVRTNSLNNITQGFPGGQRPDRRNFEPQFSPLEVSFPAMYQRSRQKDERIEQQDRRLKELAEELKSIKGSAITPNNNNSK